MILPFRWFWVVGARFFKSRSAIYKSHWSWDFHHDSKEATWSWGLPNHHGRVSSLQQPWVSQKWCPRIHWTMTGGRGSVQFLSRLISLHWVNVKWPWRPKRCDRCGANEMNPIDILYTCGWLFWVAGARQSFWIQVLNNLPVPAYH